jgi:tetratricopeptide (TPR) repeat protein
MATGLRLVTRALQLDGGTGQGTLQADVWLHALWDSAMGDLAGAQAPDEGLPAEQGGARAGQAGDRLTPELWERLVATLEALLVALDGRPEQQAWLARIESARGAAPQVAGLQYLAGMVALSRSAWDEARKLLAQAALGLPSPRLQRQAWRALARLAEAQGRADEAHHAWQQAAIVD